MKIRNYMLSALLLVLLTFSILGCLPGTSPSAAFSANLRIGNAPLTVSFLDISLSGSSIITSWLWNFGDGSTSPQTNPQHTYTTPGVYTVSLTVTTNEGNSTTTSTNFIVVNDALGEGEGESDSEGEIEGEGEGFGFEQVLIRDPQLEMALRQALGVPFSILTRADMLRLTSLNATSLGIKYLDGLETASNLINLILTDNFIENITPLANLDKLVELNLSFNGIDVIVPISGMDSLRFLDLTCNGDIDNWDPLAAVVTTNNGFLEGGSIYVDEDSVIVAGEDSQEFFTLSFNSAYQSILQYSAENFVDIDVVIGIPTGGGTCGS